MLNQTAKETPPYFGLVAIDNVEDIDQFLRSDILPPEDLFAFSKYFQAGLKEALFDDGTA